MSILNYFPEGYSPTIQQTKVLNKIQHAFTKTSTVVLCAPTGSGKSFFASTLGNSAAVIDNIKLDMISNYKAFEVDQHGQYTCEEQLKPHGALALTITKALQDQYTNLFKCTSLKGKSNYKSTLAPEMDVEIESAVIPRKLLYKHRTENQCPYHNDRRDLLTDQFGSTNYKMFMSLPSHVKCREYLICDEASELEDELVSQCSCTINYDIAAKFNLNFKKLITDETTAVHAWLDDLAQQLQEQRSYLQHTLQKRVNWSTGEQTRYKFINQLHSHVTTCLNNFYDCEYVIEKSASHVTFTPLHVNTLANSIFDHGEKTLLMSATIIDHKKYTKSLGIEDYTYIEIDSEFDSAKSPIYVSKKYALSKRTINTFLPKIINNIRELLDHHADVKGVIHTHTHDITQRVCEAIAHPRLLYREPGVSNEDILKQHNHSAEPTVLVSPSLTYGIDLKDDLARFQIIVKLPYLPLHDKRVHRLFTSDPEWYENKMLNTLVQACGRATRGHDDHSNTYILDGNIVKVLHRCKRKLPKHFLNRFV